MALRSVRAEGYYWYWNGGAVTIFRAQNGDVARDVQRRAYAVQKRMKRAAPYRYGTLRRGIRVESVRETPYGPASAVLSTAPHTMAVERGRKEIEYGPGPHPGTKLADALQFLPKRGSREKIFRNKVAEVEPSKFMENSVDAALD